MSEPVHGKTRDGRPVHALTRDYHKAHNAYARFNKRVAVWTTGAVGSMTCAWLFALLALYGLPNALRPGGTGFVPWFAQTFLQLVLLSVILVGGNIQAEAADARAAKTFEYAQDADVKIEKALDLLNVETEGGIRVILDAIDRALPGR